MNKLSLPRPTVGEEIANAVTHGVGALLSIAGLAVLVVAAAVRGDAWHVVSFAVFGFSSVVLYSMSTLYHALPFPRVKRVFKVLDHASIYLLIAGTYTPFCLTALRGAGGWALFGLIWGCAALGMALKPFLAGKLKLLSTLLYVAMGWIVVFAWKPLVAAAPGSALFLVLGGVAYTAGSAFYLVKNTSWSHPVWHGFVGAGTILHFFAVLALLG